MSDTKLLHQSFAGGEITGELHGRLDLGKFQTGLALARNFHILPHGPAQNRSGFSYVLECGVVGSAVRLIPFAFSADQTMVLEFGHLYIRFHTGGGTLLEASVPITSITEASPGVITRVAHGFLTGDTIFIAGALGMTELNGRYYKVVRLSADTYSLTLMDGTAVNTATYGAYTGSGVAARVYQLLSPYSAADLFGIHYAQDSDVLTLAHTLYPTQELARISAVSWSITPASFAPTLAPPADFGVVATVGTPGNQSPQTYCVTAIDADGVTETLKSTVVSVSNNLSIAGNYNTISWAARAGATRYNVYKQRGGAYGYIGQTAGLSIVDDNVLPDVAKTPPEDIIALNTGAGEYPQAVSYYEQRRWFGGTVNNPQTSYATRNGTESNLTSSVPSQANDGMRFRIKAQQQNAIRHLLPLTDLLALTAGGIFRIFADGAPAITPDALSVKPQGYSGASNTQPVLTSGSILYVQAQGSRVRELSYGGDSNNGSYKSVDMSVMAPHLVDGYRITDIAYTTAPLPCAWFVRSDGVLLGMTYVPEHQVYAWHRHDTLGGAFESVAAVAENNEDVLYVVVARTVNGRAVRYVERMETRFYKNSPKADAFIVDCGLQYAGSPINVLGNLYHLEGKNVAILADGAVLTQQVVTAGTVTLATAASKISVGLPIEADIETLPLAILNLPASGQGTTKNVDKAFLRVFNTTGIKAGPSADKLTALRNRSNEPFGTAPRLRTEEVSIGVTPAWVTDGALFVRQSDPVPTTILSIALGVTVGG